MIDTRITSHETDSRSNAVKAGKPTYPRHSGNRLVNSCKPPGDRKVRVVEYGGGATGEARRVGKNVPLQAVASATGTCGYEELRVVPRSTQNQRANRDRKG